MKKIICLLLVMAALLSLTACNMGPKVSIYVPETITEYTGESEEPSSVKYYVFEKGWEKKESFSLYYGSDAKTPDKEGTVITYSDKHRRTDDEQTQFDEYFDEKGNVVSQTTYYKASTQLIQTVTNYDDYGRVASQVTVTSFLGGKDTYTPQLAFTYTETEEGSEASATQNGYTVSYRYDKDYRLASYSTGVMNLEQARVEYTYDENGNIATITNYMEGKISSKQVITYKLAEVRQTTADCLPNFKRSN